jgi:glycine oxidase
MPPAVRILGHGLAGALLAWDLHRRGWPFEVLDLPRLPPSASHVGGGIINPVTGQRLVKSWRIDELLPRALSVYREIEQTFGVSLVTPFRIRRFFANDAERAMGMRKVDHGDLRPYIQGVGAEGCWIECAARVDTGRLVDVLKTFWRQRGVYRDVSTPESFADDRPIIRAVGAGELNHSEFQEVCFQPVKGEIITVRAPGLTPGVILNRGFWILPIDRTASFTDTPGGSLARVGATVDRGNANALPSRVAHDVLLAFARELLGPGVEPCGHDVGIRMTTPDRHPVVGWSRSNCRLGIINGLGSKGALLAPETARQWAEHLGQGAPFDPLLDVRRFA